MACTIGNSRVRLSDIRHASTQSDQAAEALDSPPYTFGCVPLGWPRLHPLTYRNNIPIPQNGITVVSSLIITLSEPLSKVALIDVLGEELWDGFIAAEQCASTMPQWANRVPPQG